MQSVRCRDSRSSTWATPGQVLLICGVLTALGLAAMSAEATAETSTPRFVLSVRVKVAKATQVGQTVAVDVAPSLSSACGTALTTSRKSLGFPYTRISLKSSRVKGRTGHVFAWDAPPVATAGTWTAVVSCRAGKLVRRKDIPFRIAHVPGANGATVMQGAPASPGGYGGES
jgi:hypothetical protein